MFHLPNGPELIVILAIALIFFGPKKLPEIGKSIGQGLRELKKASREITDAFNISDLSLDDDDSVSSSSSTVAKVPVPDNRPELSTNVDTPKENQHDADDSESLTNGTGSVDSPADSGAAVRSEETAGNRQVNG